MYKMYIYYTLNKIQVLGFNFGVEETMALHSVLKTDPTTFQPLQKTEQLNNYEKTLR